MHHAGKGKGKKVYGETVAVDALFIQSRRAVAVFYVIFVTQSNGGPSNFIIATQHLE